MKTDTLLSCPFCGGEAVLRVMECIKPSGEKFNQYMVECSNDCEEDPTCFASTGWEDSEEAAIAVWNTRINQQAEYSMKTEVIPADLKCCPFCGFEAQLVKVSGGYSDEPSYRVDCVNASCPAGTYGEDSPELAIEQWNRRV